MQSTPTLSWCGMKLLHRMPSPSQSNSNELLIEILLHTMTRARVPFSKSNCAAFKMLEQCAMSICQKGERIKVSACRCYHTKSCIHAQCKRFCPSSMLSHVSYIIEVLRNQKGRRQFLLQLTNTIIS